MNKILLHGICYTVVAVVAFWGGALTRDYLVTRAARMERARYAKFLNKPAPPLSSRTIDSLPWSLREQRGKVVVIEVWATWCGPCLAVLPNFKHLHERFGHRSDFQLVGASLDDDADAVKQFCERHDVGWLQLLEPGKRFESSIAQMLEVSGVPFTCVIDKEGAIRVYRDASADLERLIDRLLADTKTPDQRPTAPARGMAADNGPRKSL